MNEDEFQGKMKQMRGHAKVWWGKLSDDNLKKAGGRFDIFFGRFQEKIGHNWQQVGKENKKGTK